MTIFGSSLIGFLIAIIILVTIHEFGHFWVARRAGVKVLEFAVGFGKVIWSFRRANDPTNYSIRMIPLGGYVKMLDAREATIPENEKHLAYNYKSPRAKAAIVFAGPLANFIFAFFAMWAVFMVGEYDAPTTIDTVTQESVAVEYGFAPGDDIVAVDGKAMQTWNQYSLYLTNKAMSEADVVFTLRDKQGVTRDVTIALSAIADLTRGPVLRQLGVHPMPPPAKLDKLIESGPAATAGMLSGDEIVSINGKEVNDWRDLVRTVSALPGQEISVTVLRNGAPRTMQMVTDSQEVQGQLIGRIGVYVPDYEEKLHYSPLQAIWVSIEYNYLMLVVNLKGIWQMITGQMSLDNISGAITIAQFAGHTVESGFIDFVRFLALISLSLGIINLLPIPVLDGGHLVYIAYEAISGRAPSERFMIAAQQFGLILLFMLMSLALFNDVTRLLAVN